jgi:hypothetical protein
MAKFSDIFTNPAKYKEHTLRKHSTVVDDRKIGFVLATKTYSYDTFALNKAEFDGLMTGLREGRVAEAYVVFARISDWNSSPTYVAEIDAEKLENQLTSIEPRRGKLGPFYALDDTIADPPW